MRSLDIAGTGMQAQQTNVEVISNNIANMTTTGFKRRRAEFQDLIYQDLRRVGANSSDSGTIVPSGAQVGLGVKTAAVYRISEQGNLQQTSNSLDLAIQGIGYLQVTLPSGDTAYTRERYACPRCGWNNCYGRWLFGRPGNNDPRERAKHHDKRLWSGPGHASGPDGTADCWPASAGDFPKRGGTRR